MNKAIALLLLLVGCSALALGQRRDRFRVMEYNVENLFDTIHTEDHDDAEFTPAGAYRWNTPRFAKKLRAVGSVIANVGGDRPPELIALVEVENDSVVAALIRRTRPLRQDYDYIITHGPDPRGINVALLYNRRRFCPILSDTVRVAPQKKGEHPSRDVLHVCGRLVTGDTLDIFVLHLPSRRGYNAAQAYREDIGRAVRRSVDSLQHVRQTPLIVLTGDFNAAFPEPLFTEALRAQLPTEAPAEADALYVLSHALRGRLGVGGTYKYQGAWGTLDQFVVSGTLLAPTRSDAPCTTKDDCRVVDFPFLLKNDPNASGVRPFRTFLGTAYQGGYSDHLPLVLDLYY